MKVIDRREQFDSLYEKDVIILPIFTDTDKHSLNNILSLLYVYSLETGNSYMLSFDHSEAMSLDYRILLELPKRVGNIFTLDKKILLSIFGNRNNIYDLLIEHYLHKNEHIQIDYITPAHNFIYRKYDKDNNLNRLVPITKHAEICDAIVEKIKSVMNGQKFLSDKTYKFYNEIVIPSLFKVESNGLYVDKNIFSQFFEDKNISPDNYVYTEYNLYTSTGRPSNRYGNVNYAALHKDDGSRKAFISRFKNDGALVMFDYDAYHLRLIGEIIGYQLPTESMHVHLGKQYFNKQTLSDDEYNDSKVKSFQYLYGGVPKNVQDQIPFFNSVALFTQLLWDDIKKDGYIESPLSGRKIFLNNIFEPNPQKLFNYLIQLLETERNMSIIDKLNEYMKQFSSKLVLYTYDSFMIDFDFGDGKDFLFSIKKIMEGSGYPTKVYLGPNYDEMIDVTCKF